MGILFVVATPIGNLGDLSDRAREMLQSLPDDRRRGHSPDRAIADPPSALPVGS